MDIAIRRNAGDVLQQLGWWALFSVIAIYGVFAIAMGVSEVLFILRISPEMKHRALPAVFAVHALSGAIVLFIGPLQSVRWIRRRARVRRALGRTYVLAVWIASVTAGVDALWFDVSAPAKVVFIAVAATWFATTTIGMLRAREMRFVEKHEWMVRSYSLSLFFVTFSLWVPALAST